MSVLDKKSIVYLNNLKTKIQIIQEIYNKEKQLLTLNEEIEKIKEQKETIKQSIIGMILVTKNRKGKLKYTNTESRQNKLYEELIKNNTYQKQKQEEHEKEHEYNTLKIEIEKEKRKYQLQIEMMKK